MEEHNVLDLASLRIDTERSRHDCAVDGHRWEYLTGDDPVLRCRVCRHEAG